MLQQNDAVCVECDNLRETTLHLFLHCEFAVVIWYTVCRWLGVVIVIPADIIMSYGVLVDSGRNKKVRKVHSIVWLASFWVLWRTRNDRIFNNVAVTVDDVMDQIQWLSWKWF
jgi:hypothetical protein